MASLIVSLDQVATLRTTGRTSEPDPAQAAVLAEMAGAEGIMVRMRRDRRFIRDRDLYLLREVVKTRFVVETPPADENIARILEVKPAMVIFVADHADNDAPTSGINFDKAVIQFDDIATRLRGSNINSCFMIEPEIEAVRGAVRSGADAVMINCQAFTSARTAVEAQEELDRIDRAAQAAGKSKISLMAGRGISYQNLRPLVELGLVEEFIVGHAVISRAVLAGLDTAVRDMVRLLNPPPLTE
ncbi:MAG: pyridoxine 5'-phosphate synthase [Candidatus Zixiibacteriota bacterium]|nr:MAG: pyridoxine 5'-phosphate synthase [candidate division Zixibacteria bacterium]